MKKLINLTILGCLTSAVNVSTALAFPETLENKPLYIEALAGWAFSNWSDTMNYAFPSQTSTSYTNLKDGFSFGGNIGYKFNRYIAVEFGAMKLPTLHYTINSINQNNNAATSDSGTVSHWLVNVAGKLILPVPTVENVDLFAKLGVAYRSGIITDNETPPPLGVSLQASPFSIIQPLLGGGVQYNINQSWAMNAQYLFIPGGNISVTQIGPYAADHLTLPAVQILSLGISFNF